MTTKLSRNAPLSFGMAIAAAVVIAAPVAAESIALRIPPEKRHPATDGGARRLADRLDRAALEACGASSFSLQDMKEATRSSTCWREAMADAVRQIDDVRVAEAVEKLHANAAREAA